MAITKAFLEAGIAELDREEDLKKAELNYIVGQRDAYKFLLKKLMEDAETGGAGAAVPPDEVG